MPTGPLVFKHREDNECMCADETRVRLSCTFAYTNPLLNSDNRSSPFVQPDSLQPITCVLIILNFFLFFFFFLKINSVKSFSYHLQKLLSFFVCVRNTYSRYCLPGPQLRAPSLSALPLYLSVFFIKENQSNITFHTHELWKLIDSVVFRELQHKTERYRWFWKQLPERQTTTALWEMQMGRNILSRYSTKVSEPLT